MQTRNVKKQNSNGLAERVLGRTLPFSVEAERAVLGSLLIHDGYLPAVSDVLASQDFYSLAHQTIYKGMQEVAARRERLDMITLQDELEKKGVLQEVGGISYLLSLQEDITSVGLIEQHAKIVKEKSVLRELIQSATHIITNCYAQDDKEIETVLDEAEKTIFQISQKRAQQSFVKIDVCLKKTFEHLSNIQAHDKTITGIPTGYKKLDEMTNGFQPSDFIVLAARPSMGKTALALCIARHAAAQNLSIGFFSLEMSAEQLTLRLLSSEAGIPHQKIRNANISSEEWVELTYVAAQFGAMKMYIDDTAMQTIMDIRTKARKLKAEQNLDILVIDYLQLLHGHKHYENRHQEVSDISRSLKALAKELNIPIIALSQLSRAVDSRVDRRPMLSDLRESGAIEQDADLIMFLYRDVVYNPDTENPALAELILGKHRNGPTGTMFLHFQNNLTLFQDMD
jgi:replicative DNA helicase